MPHALRKVTPQSRGSLRRRLASAQAALVLATAASVALLAPQTASAVTGAVRAAQPSGTALSWGSNTNGQLGLGVACSTPGPNCQSPVPLSVLGLGTARTLSPVQAVSGGTEYSLALTAGGQVRAWGNDDHGELGNGTHGTEEDSPVAVVGPSGTGQLSNITAISAGNVHNLAIGKSGIGSGGQVWSWGVNLWGELGDGTNSGPEHCPVNARPPSSSDVCSTIPVGVVGPGGTGRLSGVIAVAAGDNHSVALRSDGTVWTWGLNDLGQLGQGTSSGPQTCKPFSNFAATGCSTKPVEVVGPGGNGHLSNVVAVAAGEDYTVAVRSDGSVWAWGSDAFSTLGQRASFQPELCHSPFAPIPIPCSTTPVQVVGSDGVGHLGNIRTVAANGSPRGLHVLALSRDGSVWAWGVDDMGQLGNNRSEVQSRTPVQVRGPGGQGFLTGVTAIAAGGKLSLALKSDGSVWSWGQNSSGQLGTGSTTGPQHCTTQQVACSTRPVQVVGVGGHGTLNGVVAIGAGQLHSLAVRQNLGL
jgi:alpha-tubulin suppressor-like RCC1 family protein